MSDDHRTETALTGTEREHATFVEKVRFQASLASRTRTDLGLPEDAHDSWVLDDQDTIATLQAEYAADR